MERLGNYRKLLLLLYCQNVEKCLGCLIALIWNDFPSIVLPKLLWMLILVLDYYHCMKASESS